MESSHSPTKREDTAYRWWRERAILEQVLKLPVPSRKRAIERWVPDDDALAARIRRLSRAHQRAGDFLDRPLFSIAETDPLIGSRLGAWRIDDVLGTGGMGTVFVGRRIDGSFEKTVAVKVLHRGLESPPLTARFWAERQLLADLEHPGISRLLDGGETRDGRPFLVIEYVRGQPIDRYCAARAASPADRLELLVQACRILAFAHRQGVAHCDLKPGHLLVDESGSVRLIDFGIARLLARGQPPADNMRPISPRHASPEQLRGEPPTERSDIFSMAKLGRELIAGPLSPDLDRVIDRCLADDPRRRPASMDALSEALRDELALPARRRARRRRGWLAGACLALLAYGALHLGSLEDRLSAERETTADATDWLLQQATFFDPASGSTDPAIWRRHLQDRPRVRGAVLARTARAAANAGRTADAHRLLAGALAAWAEAGGATHAELVEAGEVSLRAGDFSEAERLLFAAQRTADRFGHTSTNIDRRLAAGLGSVSSHRGMLGQATEWFGRASRTVTGSSESRLEFSRQYGQFLMAAGRPLEARELLVESLTEADRSPVAGGVDHADLLIDASKAQALLGKLEDANHHVERARAVLARRVPAAHPAQARLRTQIALLRYLEGRPATALDQARRALAFERRFGLPDEESASNLITACSAQIDLRQLDGARGSCRQALDGIRRHRGANHPMTADVLVRLAEIAAIEGDFGRAQDHLTEALDALDAVPGDRHALIGRIHHYQALHLIMNRQLADGTALHRRSLKILESTTGDSSPAVAHSIYMFAVALHQSGQPTLAEPYYEQATAGLTAALGKDHPRLAWLFRNLARLYDDLDRPRSAADAARRTLALAGEDGEPLAAEARAILARANGGGRSS